MGLGDIVGEWEEIARMSWIESERGRESGIYRKR
jgi:hypothetical protein